MWITSNISDNSKASFGASHGIVAGVSGTNVELDTAMLNKDITVVAPYGIMYAPPQGTQAMVVPTERGEVCIGVISRGSEELKPGELMLCSSGGASIKLCNDGRVFINGAEVGGF